MDRVLEPPSRWERVLDVFRSPEQIMQRYNLSQYLQQLADPLALTMPMFGMTSAGQPVEEVENSFTGYTYGAYKSNGVVFATVLARMLLFSEARFQYQRLQNGRPQDLFGNQSLGVLERPWPNGTTGELLARMEQDVSLAGNSYIAADPEDRGERLRRLRPDWVSIVLSARPEEATSVDVLGYIYTPGGPGSGYTSSVYLPNEVAHWCPIPDPTAQYRGMSWLTPVIMEIQADQSTTKHKKAFFDNGATLGPIFTFKESVTADQFRKFVAHAAAAHQGVQNAYRPTYMGGGADVTMATADLRQLDFKATQGAGETRITAAGGVPAVIVGLSEGLQAATYSNYGQARRKFGDHWARPQWRSACAALETVATPPPGARLWYDDRDIAFLREDQKDAAEIQQIKASTIRQLIDAGFEPDSVVAAVDADDRSLLKHSGLYSVQLQPPGTTATPVQPGVNGKVPTKAITGGA